MRFRTLNDLWRRRSLWFWWGGRFEVFHHRVIVRFGVRMLFQVSAASVLIREFYRLDKSGCNPMGDQGIFKFT